MIAFGVGGLFAWEMPWAIAMPLLLSIFVGMGVLLLLMNWRFKAAPSMMARRVGVSFLVLAVVGGSILAFMMYAIDARGLTPHDGSSSTIAAGQVDAFIVGVYQEPVTRIVGCSASDWRVLFTTSYHRTESGAIVYDTNATQEYSLVDEPNVLAAYNQTMRAGIPALISWDRLRDPGCRYEHAEVAKSIIVLPS
jgi:hypothetical protein